MNLPIDTCENGECSFAIRGEYDKRVYAKNLGRGGGHFPATSVCVVYQLCGRMRDNGSRTWKFLKCEKCVNHGKCKEQKRLRKMRWLIPGCMVDVERKMTTSIKKGTPNEH